MAIIDFPPPPINVGYIHTQNGLSWTWNGIGWTLVSSGDG